jgi:hypothetical protein
LNVFQKKIVFTLYIIFAYLTGLALLNISVRY